MLEIDCHITKDGQVVVSHDSSLKRSCGQEGEISDFNYEVGNKSHAQFTLNDFVHFHDLIFMCFRTCTYGLCNLKVLWNLMHNPRWAPL